MSEKICAVDPRAQWAQSDEGTERDRTRAERGDVTPRRKRWRCLRAASSRVAREAAAHRRLTALRPAFQRKLECEANAGRVGAKEDAQRRKATNADAVQQRKKRQAANRLASPSVCQDAPLFCNTQSTRRDACPFISAFA